MTKTEYRRAWRLKNIEKVRECNRRSKLKNKEKIRLRRMAEYWKDPQKKLTYTRAWWARNSHKRKEYAMRRVYNLDPSEFAAMLVRQNGVCAVCEQSDPKRNLSIDHNHGTGRIRGLLCKKCNSAIGFAGDSPVILRKMAMYLEGENNAR